VSSAPGGRPAKRRGAAAHFGSILPNGLRLLCVPKKGASRAVITMLVRVGSRFETEETNGISHFLEHMLYRGCPSKKTAHEQALAFEELGASLYAATQADYGTLTLSLPAESFVPAVSMFAEVVRAPRFSDIEIERGIVREEILEDLDDDGRQIDADNLTRALIYGSHPLGFTITGSIKQLQRFDRSMLEKHHALHYTAENSVLCFAGAVDPELSEKLAKKHFSRLPRGGRIIGAPPPQRQRKPRFRHVRNVSSQTTLRIAFRAVSEHDPREPAVEMLLRILDDGMSTRLYERICDAKGLCYDVGALYESYEDDGVFDVAAEVQHERALQVTDEIFDVLEDLAEKGPTARELDKAKARHGWQMEAMLEDPEALGGYYALASLADLARTPALRHEQLSAVTRKDVRDAAELVFRRDRLNVVAVGALRDEQERALQERAAGFGKA
jgi:predicted Zn-dependent peptidase